MPHRTGRRRRLCMVGVVVGSLAAAAIPAAAGAATTVPAAAGVPTSAGSAPSAAAAAPPAAQRTGVVPGKVILILAAGTSVTGHLVAGTRVAARVAQTSSAQLNTVLRADQAVSLHPLFPNLAPQTTKTLIRAGQFRTGSDASDLSNTYILQVGNQNSMAVASSLQQVPGVAYAEPDRYVNTTDAGAQPLSASVLKAAPAEVQSATDSASGSTAAQAGATGTSHIPTNYALADSAQPMLNAGGVDATGAFALLGDKYSQLPGAGENITDVTLGDLTDESMDDTDGTVAENGPTTVLMNGQRYIDVPSMPLIPTYVADPDGTLNGTESTEGQDPLLTEALLDFGVMAPLPDDKQRPGMTGSGYRDLLGIAPGANYRLVVPQQPTTDDIAEALLAAANQSPRPNVITATVDFGTDAQGFPGRYLEEDPLVQAIVTAIVHEYGIVVAISADDGTRLFTPASVGPDGGSTPTDLASSPASATNINDDSLSTVPGAVVDSGAIDVGGDTTDDTLADGTAGPAVIAETRISGAGNFSSGFGSRVDVSAPSDNILGFSHPKGGAAEQVDVSLIGGTSASGPEVGATASVVLQAARLAGHPLNPLQVRSLLESTGHAVGTPAQLDRPVDVGPEIDVTAATEAALGLHGDTPTIVRLSVGHHVEIGDLGGAFQETTDPQYLDLGPGASGPAGAGLAGPVTFAADVTGLADDEEAQYTLTVGRTTWHSTGPAIRVTPTGLLTAAGLPVISTADRTVSLTYRVLVRGRVQAYVQRTLTVGPTDGQYAEAQAPTAPAVVALGKSVTAGYDLAGVTGLINPSLVVSTVGHWNPELAPNFTAAWSTPVTATSGKLTIPATAFDDGGGIYGIGIVSGPATGAHAYQEFTPIRISGRTAAQRPATPTLISHGTTAPAHFAQASRAEPDFTLDYSVKNVPGAASALVEFSAPGATINGSYNTFTNADGTQLDDDGVDNPSTAHTTLPGTSGSVHLNGLKLGLPTSETYGVRVFALDRNGRIVGQASPVASLEFDDGLAPNGDLLLDFAAAGSNSLVALLTQDQGTEVAHYNTATGEYGSVMAEDDDSGSQYDVLGVAPASDRALLAHQSGPTATTMQLQTWNTATDTMVGSVTVDATQWTLVVAHVDAARDRAAVLLRSASPADSDGEVLAVNLADGEAWHADPPPGTRRVALRRALRVRRADHRSDDRLRLRGRRHYGFGVLRCTRHRSHRSRHGAGHRCRRGLDLQSRPGHRRRHAVRGSSHRKEHVAADQRDQLVRHRHRRFERACPAVDRAARRDGGGPGPPPGRGLISATAGARRPDRGRGQQRHR